MGRSLENKRNKGVLEIWLRYYSSATAEYAGHTEMFINKEFSVFLT